MRGDDGAGCKFIEELRRSKKTTSSRIYLFNGGQMPENYLEPIVKIEPDQIFIVDAVDFNASPGTFKLFERVEEPQMSFSTHTLSLHFILDYLREKTQARVFVLGIQPGQFYWGSYVSPGVREGIKKLVGSIYL